MTLQVNSLTGFGAQRANSLAAQVIALFEGGARSGSMHDSLDLSTTFQDRSATPSTPAGVSDPLGTLTDLGPNGHNIIAPSAAESATVSATGAVYDGANDCHEFSSNPLSGASVGFAIARAKLDANPPTIGRGGINDGFGTGFNTHHPFSDGDFFDDFGSTTRGNFGSFSAPGTSFFTVEFHRGASNLDIYLDGSKLGSSFSSSVGWGSAPRIGASATVYFFKGVIAKHFTIDKIPSAEELTLLREWAES